VEINTEAAGGDIIEHRPPDDKPSAGMFGILYCCIVCINLCVPHILGMQMHCMTGCYFLLMFFILNKIAEFKVCCSCFPSIHMQCVTSYYLSLVFLLLFF